MFRLLFGIPVLWLMFIGPASAETQASLPDRVEQWMDHVVLLLTGPAWCTGVVIDDAGTVATAYHCVASGLRTEVRTRKGGHYIGKMIAADPKNDVALVAVPELGSFMKGMPIREEEPRHDYCNSTLLRHAAPRPICAAARKGGRRAAGTSTHDERQ